MEGQVNGFLAIADDAASTQEKPVSSFTLPTQASGVQDAIADFNRFVEHEAWEKAFKSLETITSKTSAGFIDRKDNVWIPGRMVVQSLSANLPPAGKSAYRVFYDAQATALWDKASGAAELESLSSIVDNHLASSVGAAAADRLGDLYFERGDLEQAVVAWRNVLDFCPDSTLSKAQLHCKIATALARADRWIEFGEVKRTIEERFAADNIQVAGRPWAAGQYVARLAAGAKAEPGAAIAPLPPDFELPATDEPLWQFRFQSKADPANPSQPFALQDDYGRTRANDFPIPAATDGRRMYTNVFGVEMAFDLSTGKMIWRTGRLHQLNFQNQQGVRPERYGIAVIGDRVWSVTRDPQQLNRSPPTFSLVARENATAKETFNSRRSLSSWNIMSLPIVVDGSFAPVANPTRNLASSAQESGASGATSTLDWSKGFSAGMDRLSLNGIEYSGYGYANPNGGESSIQLLLPTARLRRGRHQHARHRLLGRRLRLLRAAPGPRRLRRDRDDRPPAMGPPPQGCDGGRLLRRDQPAFRWRRPTAGRAAIAPLSVIGDTQTTLYPGGILNSGFALSWAKDRVHDACRPRQPAARVGPISGSRTATRSVPPTRTCTRRPSIC